MIIKVLFTLDIVLFQNRILLIYIRSIFFLDKIQNFEKNKFNLGTNRLILIFLN